MFQSLVLSRKIYLKLSGSNRSFYYSFYYFIIIIISFYYSHRSCRTRQETTEMAWLWTTIAGASLGRPTGLGTTCRLELKSHEELLTYMAPGLGDWLSWGLIWGFSTPRDLISSQHGGFRASGSLAWQLRSPFASI